MTVAPPSPVHVEKLIENSREVVSLFRLTRALAGGTPGRKKPQVEQQRRALRKAGLVLIVACWEAFVEDVCVATFDAMLSNAKDPGVFPPKVLAIACKELHEDKSPLRLWSLAGEGWRQVLNAHRDAVHAKLIEPFHSPKAKKVDDLIEEMVGLKNVSDHWHWRGTSADSARGRLEELIGRRGDIAHRVQPKRPVYQHEVNAAIDLVSRLGAITSNTMAAHVEARCGIVPWTGMTYKGVG